MAEQKTNVMRILGQKKIRYDAHEYPHGEGAVDGLTVARMTGRDPACVFKTLVTRGGSREIYVFVIPVADELDLKKAAKAAGEKSIEMIKEKELLPLTGYVHGGCSPIGMKKPFPTFVDSTAADYETIMFSAGKIGYQVQMGIGELAKAVSFTLADLRSED